MNEEIYDYLKNYIEKKQPISYTNMNKREYFTLIDKIAAHSIFKKYSVKEIQSGRADAIIDEVFNQYVRSKIGDGVSFEQLCRYVKDIVETKYDSLTSSFDDKILNRVIRDIVSNVVDSGEIEYSRYISGSYDKFFLDKFKSEYDKMYNECKSHILYLLANKGLGAKFNFKTNEKFIDKFVSGIMKEKIIGDISAGYYDEFIVSKFNNSLIRYKDRIQGYVRNFLLDRDVLAGVPIEDVVNYITKNIIETGKFSADDLFKRRLDNYIDKYADSVNTISASNAAINYVYKKVKVISDGRLNDNNLLHLENELYNRMMEDGCNSKDIVSGKYDKYINNYVERKIMILLSIKDKEKNKSKGIKHDTKKKKINKKALMLVILTLVSAYLIPRCYNNAKEVIEYVLALDEVKDYNDFNYGGIYSADNNYVKPSMINALDFYNKVKDSNLDNSNYKYLGFFVSYNNTKQDRLHVMDRALDYAIREVRCNSEYEDIKDQIIGKKCYLEFVMDRLYELGFKEIRDDKYVAALAVYVNAMNNPTVDKPMDAISDEYQDIIEEIMEKYREYNKELIVEFSDLIDEEDYDDTEDYTELKSIVDEMNGSRRSM